MSDMWREASQYARYMGYDEPEDWPQCDDYHIHRCPRCTQSWKCADDNCTLPIVFDCDDCTSGFDRPLPEEP